MCLGDLEELHGRRAQVPGFLHARQEPRGPGGSRRRVAGGGIDAAAGSGGRVEGGELVEAHEGGVVDGEVRPREGRRLGGGEGGGGRCVGGRPDRWGFRARARCIFS